VGGEDFFYLDLFLFFFFFFLFFQALRSRKGLHGQIAFNTVSAEQSLLSTPGYFLFIPYSPVCFESLLGCGQNVSNCARLGEEVSVVLKMPCYPLPSMQPTET